MKRLFALAAITMLLASVTMSGEVFAQKSGQQQVQDIMTAYKKAIFKAQSDFNAAVKKANESARAAIEKGIPIDKINADSKAAISKAREDLKVAKKTAQKEAKASLDKLKDKIKRLD
ncbi:MAG: hypothetical protein ACKO7N_04985 [Candidatus Nitrosotenuis sp.]